jgi:hypothetical protein
MNQFPTQYTWSGQPSTTTQFHVILKDGLHLQARPDDSHGRSAKYAGDVYKPGFGGRLFFNLSCYWFLGSSSRARFWPVLHGRCLWLDNCSRPLCHPCHKFFYGGGWTATPLSRPAHYVLVISFPLINGVRIKLSAYKILQDKYSTTLLEVLTS